MTEYIRTTERGTRASKAVIVIGLWNQVNNKEDPYTNDPYEPDSFGRQIIFERTIYATQTKLRIFGESGSGFEVPPSRAREVGQRILQHFNIELKNPLTFLQQEEAKQFFKMQSNESLYNYFASGTMLSQISTEQKLARVNISQICQQLKEEHDKKDQLKKELDQLEKHYQSFNLQTRRKSQLHGQAKWAMW